MLRKLNNNLFDYFQNMDGFITYFSSNYDLLEILLNCFYSFKRVAVGVFAASFVGITMGLVRSSLPNKIKHMNIIKFLFEAPKFPPPIAWIPFVIIIFGIGELSAYSIVFIGAFAPLFINTYEGAESVSNIVKYTARSMEIKGLKFYVLIILPACSPQILTGIRAGISMGWMSVIAAEMISGQSGLGYSIQLNRLNLRYDLVIVDIFLIGLIGFFLFESINYLEQKVIPWHIRALKSQ